MPFLEEHSLDNSGRKRRRISNLYSTSLYVSGDFVGFLLLEVVHFYMKSPIETISFDVSLIYTTGWASVMEMDEI